MKRNLKKMLLALLLVTLSGTVFAAEISINEFFKLCEEGKADEVEKALVDKRAYVDAQDSLKRTALMRSIRENQPTVVDVLLKFHLKIDLQDYVGCTALMVAAECDRPEIAEALIKAGANIDTRDKSGRTALHVACLGTKDDLELVKLLVKYGADIELRDNDGGTPLHYAAINGHSDIVGFLIAFGAKLKSVDNFFYLCATGKAEEVEKALAEKREYVNVQTDGGKTALHIACEQSNNPKLIELLIAQGANPEQEDHNGLTPLMTAVGKGHVNVVKALLKAGVNTETKNENDGSTAIFYTVKNDNGVEVARILLDCGANVNAKTKDSKNTLHTVVFEENADVVEFLIKAGIDVNARDKFGRTPIMIVAWWSKGGKVLDTLLKNGVDLKVRDKNGHNILWYLSENFRMPEDQKNFYADKIFEMMQK